MTTPLNNKKGTTLVELIVCLVLLALFGTAAVTLVKPCAEAYIEVQQLTRAQNLADALTETIRGELADADGTISIVNAATDKGTKDDIFKTARLTEGTALRFTVENNYVEVLDAGYVPMLYNMEVGSSYIYSPPTATGGTTSAPLENYLHMRFYKLDGTTIKHSRPAASGKNEVDCVYAYTTAYPNGDYMGLIISDLKFYARGWEREKDTGKVRLTSLSMQLTIAKPSSDGVASTPVYTATAVIPLPGAPEFQ